MNKISVGATVAHAYEFTFGHFVRLLGITWAPTVALIAVTLMVTPGFIGNHMPLNDYDEVIRQSMRLTPFLLIFSFIIRAMIGVGVTELALGKRDKQTFVYFSLGAAVWRLVGAWLLFVLVMVLIYIGLIILTIIAAVAGGFGLKSMALSHGGNSIAIGLLILGCFLLFFGALVYTLARLTFLIPPVVVEEKQIDLARGWQLTKGNFWRIFAIGIAIFVPLILIEFVIFSVFFGVAFFHQFADIMATAMQHPGEQAMQQQMNAWSASIRARSLEIWPFTAVLGVLVSTIASGLMFGASAFAYRALVPSSGSMTHN